MNITKTKKDVQKHTKLSTKRKIKGAIKSLIRPRSFKAYCVGTAKSGTHSVAAIFEQNFRSEHEPDGGHLIFLKNEFNHGRINEAAVLNFLKKRDIRNNLHMESSDFAGYFVKEFVSLDPNAKFILPIRDCYSFIDSIINHQINNPVENDSIWKLGRDVNYGIPAGEFKAEEAILADYKGLYPIENYLQYWAQRNTQVLNIVPESKLLAFKTSQIKNNLNAMSQFFKVPAESLNIGKSHSFQAPKKYNLLAQIDPDYIENLVIETGCKEVMADFYPNIKTLHDVLAKEK